MRPVKVLGRKDSTCLVEWIESGRLMRSFVPCGQIKTVDNATLCESPEIGIPYGLPWSLIVQDKIDAQEFENELHKRGIWTYEDFQKNPQIVISSLQKVLKQTIAEIRSSIFNFQGE